MVFLTSLQSIMPIVLLISLGYFLKGRGMFNDTFSSNLSRLIMSVILPVGVFMSVLHNVQTSDLWDLRYGLLVVMMTYVVSYIIAFIMMKIVHVPRGRRGIFINMVVNDNCLFIGLPVQIALFGPDALPFFLLYYIGNTISVWMFGVFLIEADPLPTNGASHGESFRTLVRKFSWKKLLPPPLLGFFLALVFLYAQIPLPTVLHNTLNYIGNMVTPLSLLYIGIVLHDAGPTTSVIVPWAVLLGSLAQLIASYFDFKKNNPFGSVVFGAYGLFWSAMAGVWLIQMGSFGPEIQKGFDVTQLAFAFVGFLIFSIFGTIASLKTNKVVFAIMLLICFLFFGLATDLFLGGKTGFFALAAWSELFISLLGFYGSGAVLVNKVFGKTVFPMGKSIL